MSPHLSVGHGLPGYFRDHAQCRSCGLSSVSVVVVVGCWLRVFGTILGSFAVLGGNAGKHFCHSDVVEARAVDARRRAQRTLEGRDVLIEGRRPGRVVLVLTVAARHCCGFSSRQDSQCARKGGDPPAVLAQTENGQRCFFLAFFYAKLTDVRDEAPAPLAELTHSRKCSKQGASKCARGL